MLARQNGIKDANLHDKDARLMFDNVQQLERSAAGEAEALLPTFDR